MTAKEKDREKRDRIAQWAFDTSPILRRFNLWLEDVEIEWLSGEKGVDLVKRISFLDGRMERLMVMTAAVTAMGTHLFGRFGEGTGKDKTEINRVKKDADAISAYAMSEGLWFASRYLPENHAIMVCLGEGLMPKSGETEEMGSNPQLGFGRVYARARVAQWLDRRVTRLLNDGGYDFDDFYTEVKEEGITLWGAAIDTLENTSRFAMGMDTGPMTVMHLFNQPLLIRRPYEGYIGNLILPRRVVETAMDRSVLLDFRTPRVKVVEAVEAAYPGIRRQDIHVWTLRGKGRVVRLGELWKEWESLGVHLVDDDYALPSGITAFTESGTYAPISNVGTWKDDKGRVHLFLCDGYAASAEAMQAASLAHLLGLEASLVPFTSLFGLPYHREQQVMGLDIQSPDFSKLLEEVIGEPIDDAKVDRYRQMISEARDAGIRLDKRVIRVEDFFPEKRWEAAAVVGYMQSDPYSGAPGVEEVGENAFRTAVRLTGSDGDKRVDLTLRLMEKPEVSRLAFNPLLIRFIYGEDYKARPVKISDSGRIRNELQTLCSEALEYKENHIGIHFDRIHPDVISHENQKSLLEVLKWYKKYHPIWFSWLDIVPPT